MSERSWLVDAIGAPTFQRLASGLAGSELQSVLLEVMRCRAAARKPKDILAQYRRDAFCAPANIDLRTSRFVDSHLLAAAHEFEAVELSPVAPLGVCSAVAVTDQNRVLSALRMTEVMSDPTNVLALECASRMRTHPNVQVHLATSQRVVRAQPVPKLPGYSQHFRIFVLSSGGSESKNHTFTTATLLLHIRTMLSGLERLERHGYSFGQPRVKLFATPEKQRLADRIAQRLGEIAEHQLLEHSYYSGGLRFQIWVSPTEGPAVPLVDGGVFDWLAQIASNRRAVYVASGTGAELIALRFRKPEAMDTTG